MCFLHTRHSVRYGQDARDKRACAQAAALRPRSERENTPPRLPHVYCEARAGKQGGHLTDVLCSERPGPSQSEPAAKPSQHNCSSTGEKGRQKPAAAAAQKPVLKPGKMAIAGRTARGSAGTRHCRTRSHFWLQCVAHTAHALPVERAGRPRPSVRWLTRRSVHEF